MKGLDTNILVRLLVRDDPVQTAQAEAFIEQAYTAGDRCLISHAALVELAWVLRAAYGYERAQIADAIERILLTSEFHVERAEIALAAVRAYRTSGADFADCLIGKINSALGCAETATFDRNAARLPEFELLTGA